MNKQDILQWASEQDTDWQETMLERLHVAQQMEQFKTHVSRNNNAEFKEAFSLAHSSYEVLKLSYRQLVRDNRCHPDMLSSFLVSIVHRGFVCQII